MSSAARRRPFLEPCLEHIRSKPEGFSQLPEQCRVRTGENSLFKTSGHVGIEGLDFPLKKPL